MEHAANKPEMFKALLEITQELNSIHKIDDLLRRVMDIVMETLQADRGFIILKDDPATGEFSVPIARNLSRQDLEDITGFSSSVVQQVLNQGESILSYDAQTDDRFRESDSIVINRIQSIAAVPLRRKGEIIGAIYVDHVGRHGRFDQSSLDFLTAFANQAAIAIENARLFSLLHQENEQLRQQVQEQNQFTEIIGRSAAMQRIFKLVQKVMRTDATVLIEGESGTGKELIARALHYSGPRKDRPFIAVFCGALSESLLESELFGHRKGSFTGAKEEKKGLLEVAHGGTVFLDEISEVSPNIQTKLLRFLQEGEIKRVGDTHIRKVDVRVIAATNKNLKQEVEAGRFREDLYYRLDVIHITMPPLRERIGDVPILAHHFLQKYNQRIGRKITGFTPEAMAVLESYEWPGNVRELENTIERAVIMANDDKIDVEDLQLEQTTPVLKPGMSLKDLEKKLVLKTLHETGNNISKTAEILGVSRRWLHYRLKEWEDEA